MKQNYRVIKAFGTHRVGDVFCNVNSDSGIVQSWLHGGLVELDETKTPFGLEPKGLRLRVCEYQKRILQGDVTPGEVVFLRGVKPPTIARIRAKDPHSNAFLVNMAAGRDAYMVDFDPIDWSEYWVDSGLKIQRWEDLKEGYVYQIAEGNYPHRPGADEAAERECERRRQARKSFDVSKIRMTVGGHEIGNIDPKLLEGKAPTGLPVYDKHGLVIDELVERQRADRLDRQAMRERIAKRLGVSTRHISEDSINYELAVKGAARVAANLAEKRQIPNKQMRMQSVVADAKGFFLNRFEGCIPFAEGLRVTVKDITFGNARVDAVFSANGPMGCTWYLIGSDHQGNADTFMQAADDFEAWVRDQFVEEEPAAPREVVTYHVGTGDMGGYGTGGHR